LAAAGHGRERIFDFGFLNFDWGEAGGVPGKESERMELRMGRGWGCKCLWEWRIGKPRGEGSVDAGKSDVVLVMFPIGNAMLREVNMTSAWRIAWRTAMTR
jgi:hypothetical protein